MTQRLTIEFRQKQLLLDQDPLQPIIVQCNVDGTAEYVPGTNPIPGWVNVTEDTEGLDKFSSKWSATQGEEAEGNEIGSNYQKGISTNLRFFNTAFKFIDDWLLTDPCQTLNSIEVKITDKECTNTFRTFEIKVDNIKERADEPCIVETALREHDPVIHAFQKTIIEDNWQGWFNKDGTSTKDHPTFSFIVEKKPKFFLAFYVVLIYIAGMLSTGILIALTEGKKWIRKTLGFTYFCPSPLIRTYIQNICDKYGFTFDTMFDDDPANEYRDVCLFFPGSTSLKNFEDYDSPSTKFIWDNRTVYPFTKFLNDLKKVFNAEWYVTPNSKLVFKPKTFFDTQAPLYDFTAPGADTLEGLEYTFNGKKKAAYGDYQYRVDPQDTCSNEVKYRYNDIVDFDGPADNPMLEGKVQKSFEFAMTAFHNDGSSKDFIEDAVTLGRLIAVGAVLVGLGEIFLSSNFITVAIVVALLTVGYVITNDYVNNFFDNDELNGMVRVSNSEINIPRLLLWDRTTPLNKSKVVSVEDPAQYPKYNIDAVDYYTEHPTYEDPGYFGTTVTKVWNYPMFVDANFTENLFGRFHEIDNPLFNPTINKEWEGNVDLCCEWLDRLGVWEADFAKIGYVLTLENRRGRLIKGRLTDFDVDYDAGRIHLNGTVLK